LLAASLGGVVGLVLHALGRPPRALGTNGDPLLVGQANSATAETALTESGGGYDGAGLKVVANARSAAIIAQADNEFAAGVRASSANGHGVVAQGRKNGVVGIGEFDGVGVRGSNGYGGPGVRGESIEGVGVHGHAGSGSPPSAPAGTGVVGTSKVAVEVNSILLPGTGVYGYAGGGTPPATPLEVGVNGVADYSPASTGLRGVSPSGTGIRATSTSGTGIQASSSTGRAIWGLSGSPAASACLIQSTAAKTAVHGYSGGGAAPAAPTIPTGVYGQAAGTDGTGVWGYSATAGGAGVYGESSIGVWGYGGWGVFGASGTNGTGVYGVATGGTVPGAPVNAGIFGYSATGVGVQAGAGSTGTALKVVGKATFSRSGKISVTAGQTSYKKYVAGLTSSSLVIAQFQSNESGVWIRAAVPAAGYFIAYFSKALPSSATVGWIAFN
jgi:hypothetical protein